ncbi:hypothetical protein [Deinococcus arcticus]|uniref:Uncharacterized protein n=1 Tax=Deinococcus arcticus TaxID=2136176 RepID=A0A2T3WAP0_9DEIO|nr:hypothetical protein [Deinococcus arcticus]PTA68970.1 hypothetical protein C8263_03995 [Deinococcus arcticus]
MKKIKWMMGAALTALGLSGAAGAADVRLGLNSSLGLGCQVVGVRAGVQEGRVGVHAQGAYCLSGVQGRAGGVAVGAAVSFDLFRSGGLTTYALAGADLLNGNSALHAGLGLRYGIPLIPVEGYIEAGVQRISTVLQPIVGPRLALGVNYKVNVANLQGTLPATGAATGDSTPAPAPAECKLTPDQDAAAARATAQSAAEAALSAAASAYSAGFSSFSYKVNIGSAAISGNTAQVSGSVTITLVARGSNTQTSDTYTGTVTLVRDGCGWVPTGYRQN